MLYCFLFFFIITLLFTRCIRIIYCLILNKRYSRPTFKCYSIKINILRKMQTRMQKRKCKCECRNGNANANAETEMQIETQTEKWKTENDKWKTINEERNGNDGKRWDDWNANANEPQTKRKWSVNKTELKRKWNANEALNLYN